MSTFPFPIPHGWFGLYFSHELKASDVKKVRFCGRDLVVFRTESGKPAAPDNLGSLTLMWTPWRVYGQTHMNGVRSTTTSTTYPPAPKKSPRTTWMQRTSNTSTGCQR
jgi:hypothetical protein